MKARFLIIPAIVLAAVACQKEEDNQTETRPVRPEETSGYTLTIEAVKNVDTKALELENNGGTLTSSWVQDEKVDVYLGGELMGTLLATPDASSNNLKATLTATLDKVTGIQAGSTLTLIFPGREDHLWDYTGQDGSAPTPSGILSTKYDFAIAEVEIDAIDNNTITPKTGATFTNQQSIYRFGFKQGNDYIDPIDFTVSASGNTIVQSFSYQTDAWTPVLGNSLSVTTPTTKPTDSFYYLSLLNQNTTSNEHYSFKLTGPSNELLMGSKDVAADHLDQGKFISMKNITVSQPSFAPASGSISSASEVY